MMDFAIHLQARAPERNIWRAYSITGGQDLFGDWIVVLSYSRIGAKGAIKTARLTYEAAVRHYVRQCLKKRDARSGGKSGGFRTLILFRIEALAFFCSWFCQE